MYFVAGVGVVYNIHDNRQRFFFGHDDDILRLVFIYIFDCKIGNKVCWAIGQEVAEEVEHNMSLPKFLC